MKRHLTSIGALVAASALTAHAADPGINFPVPDTGSPGVLLGFTLLALGIATGLLKKWRR